MDGNTRIILLNPKDPGDPHILRALMRVFGLSEGLAGKILAATPIAVLRDMTFQQAAAVLAEMKPLTQAGAQLQIEMRSDARVNHVGWPSPPRIAGKPLDEYNQKEGTRITPAPLSPDPAAPPAPPDKTDRLPAAGTNFLEDEEEDLLFSGLAPLHDTTSVPIIGNAGWRNFDDPNLPREEKQETEKASPPADDPQPHTPSQRAPLPGAAKPNTRKAEALPALSPGPFNVAIPGTDVPEAVMLVSALLNIDPREAEQELRKPLLVVARNIDRLSATEVSGRFKDLGIKARITRTGH